MKTAAIAVAVVAAAGQGQEAVSPLVIVGLAGAALAGFVLRIYLFPYRKCPRCEGTGMRPGSTGRAFGICGKCRGTRETLRPAARFFRSHRDDR